MNLCGISSSETPWLSSKTELKPWSPKWAMVKTGTPDIIYSVVPLNPQWVTPALTEGWARTSV